MCKGTCFYKNRGGKRIESYKIKTGKHNNPYKIRAIPLTKRDKSVFRSIPVHQFRRISIQHTSSLCRFNWMVCSIR